MASSYKDTKRSLSESDSENEVADFLRFIVIESLEEVCQAKLYPILIEKVITVRAISNNKKIEWKLACRGGQLWLQ